VHLTNPTATRHAGRNNVHVHAAAAVEPCECKPAIPDPNAPHWQQALQQLGKRDQREELCTSRAAEVCMEPYLGLLLAWWGDLKMVV